MKIVLANRTIDAPALIRAIDERVRHGDAASFLAIVPTRRRANVLRRQWLLASPNESAPRFPVFTLSDLVALLADSALPVRRSVTKELQIALLEQAVRASSLGYFTKRKKSLPRGTLETILNTIIKIKESGVLPAALLEAVERGDEHEREKSIDVASLYQAYEEKLKGKFRDEPGALLELNAALETQSLAEIFDRALAGWSAATNRIIVIEGFSEFRKPECAFLSRCAGIPDVTALIVSDYVEGNRELFGHLQDHIERLQSNGFTHTSLVAEHDTLWKERIQKNLFSDGPIYSEANGGILHVTAPNRAGEAALVARIVKKLVMEKPDRDLSRICVATRTPKQYTTLFREAFADAGIPVNITDRFPLDASSVAVGFLALLDLRLRDFRMRDVARALASPYFTLKDPKTGRAVDANNLIALATRFRIVGGYRSWIERIASRRGILMAEGRDDDIDPAREIAECTQALNDLVILDAMLLPHNEKVSPSTFLRHAAKLFDECHTAHNIFGGTVNDVAILERETRAYHALRELIEGVCGILQDQRGQEPLSLSEFARQIRAAITVARYNVRPRSGKGVLITSPEETRGLDIDVMILAGMIDGEFPLPYAPEIFLSKDYKTSRKRHAQDERYLFYQAATNWTEQLVLTAPRADYNGNNLVPSSFLDAFADHVTWAVDADDEPARDIIAMSDLHRAMGEYAVAGGHAALSDYPPEIAADILSRVNTETQRHEHAVPELEGRIANALNADQLSTLTTMRSQVWSASQLELYGKCPFKFFSSKILRLDERDELVEGLSPLEKGNLLHEILFTYFIRRRFAQLPALHALSNNEAAEARQALLATAGEIIDALKIEHPFWRLDIERYFGLSGTRGILHKFFDFEQARDAEVTPQYFEVRFGTNRNETRTDNVFFSDDPVDFGEWKLRGKIDRIDASVDECVIVDYKTGALPTLRDIDDGTSLQLPLYIRAVEMLLQQDNAPTGVTSVAGGMYYELKKDCEIVARLVKPDRQLAVTGDGHPKRRKLKDGEYEVMIDRAFSHVNNFLNNIAAAEFPLTRPELRDKQCGYCSYQAMCRVRDEAGAVGDVEETAE